MKDFRLGVLLVHGIGTQPPRDTLVRWGDVLIKLIGRATRPPGAVVVTAHRASAGDRSGDRPAEVAVDIRYAGKTERWLLAEGWWAESFPAPTYAELVSWSVRAIPWAIALYIAQRYWQAEPNAPGRAKLTAALQFFVAMAFAPVLITLMGLALLLGLLPIPQLRSLILSAQTTLVGTIGDSLAFVESPLRAALIRGRILDGLDRLKERCESTVIVAHSQGAAAVLDALGGIMPAADHDEKPATPEPEPAGAVPDVLVTFGSGVNQLVNLKVLSGGPPGSMKDDVNPAAGAVLAILVLIGLLAFLYAGLQFGLTTIAGLAQAFVLYVVSTVVFAVLALGANWLIDKFAAGREDITHIKLWSFGVLVVAVVAAAIVYADLRDMPLMPVIFFVLALISLAGSLTIILSSATKEKVTKPIRKPPGVNRWVDLYASADPVSNGPTPNAESVEIWNRGSFLSDHTSYWDNLDGFVLRIARLCAETAKSPWQDKLPEMKYTEWIDLRTKWRVDVLRWAVRLNLLLWLIGFVLLWQRHLSQVPLPFDLPAWAPREASMIAGRVAVLAALVALAAGGTYVVLGRLWSGLARAEQELLLAHSPPTTTPVARLAYMGMVISLLVILAFALARGYASRASDILVQPGEWFTLPMLMIGGGVGLAMLTLWLKPAPEPPDTSAADAGTK